MMGHPPARPPPPPMCASPLPPPSPTEYSAHVNVSDLLRWIQRWIQHLNNRDPVKLEKLGVNVDGVSGGARGLPLPIFDETQWDHVRDQPRDNEWEDVEKRERRDTGLHVLKKAGIVGKINFPKR
jgi:hypothetical protein